MSTPGRNGPKLAAGPRVSESVAGTVPPTVVDGQTVALALAAVPNALVAVQVTVWLEDVATVPVHGPEPLRATGAPASVQTGGPSRPLMASLAVTVSVVPLTATATDGGSLSDSG